MPRRPIQEQWESFRAAVVRPEATAAQVAEARAFFFSGAAAVYSTLMAELSEDENDDPSIEDVRLMEAIQAELDEFSKSTGVGIQKH